MDGPRLLSGSEIVAKGATKKVDGQLPQTGLKEVSANGSWLEQKQIQSALEARKHLIAVERIEKSGSISHAEWRDELKLAEVTKQTGAHWHYIGHKTGKHLYLLPEETLFLLEINSLLLKHNDVTVSLQKAYALCLTEIPLMQYKVYASLSRLGYRVCRHKKPKSTEETDSNISKENDMETYQNDTEKGADECKEKTNETTSTERGDTVVQNAGNKNNSNKKVNNTEYCDVTVVQTDNSNEDINISKDGGTSASDDNKTENIKIEVVENNITSRGENCTNAAKKVLENGVMPIDKKTDDLEANIMDTTKNTDNLNKEKPIKLSCSDKEKSANNDTLLSNQENVDITATTMDIVNDNTEGALDRNRNIKALKQECTENLPHAINSGIVYSIDEIGVVRPGEKIITVDTSADSSSEINVQVHPNDGVPKTKDSDNVGCNDSPNVYQAEIKYYDQKIHKICDRKTANQTNKGLDTLQDLYKERIVDVNVPEETYLPRNIFLHKTAYRLNIDVIQNQNASSVSSDEMNSVESPSRTPSVPNIQNHTYQPNYENNNTNNIPRYPSYRFERPQYYRQNFHMFRPPMQGYYTPRWRLDFMRHQYMAYQANRRDTMKSYHYNTIVNIATRFKSGFIANPSQIRVLHSLLNTYNLRYNATLGITPDFNIIDTKDQPQPEPVVENVIVLDDEPKRKKQRLNDEGDRTKTNLEKLKELAAKLKDLHTRDLDTSRHRRVFSNAIKSYNKSFKADIYLNDNFVIVDRKLVVLDSSSDSEPVMVIEKERPRKRKKLRNPYSILRQAAQVQKDHASTSTLPESQRLSQAVNEDSIQNDQENHANTALMAVDYKNEGLLKYFEKAWLPDNDDFGRAEPCSKQKAQLDALVYQAEYLEDILKESTDFESWKDIKIAVLKEIRGSLDVQKQQAEALSNDFYMETESQIRPILDKRCSDLKTALKKLSVIPTNKEITKETSLRIHFDVCNRDVPFKKSSPPKPNFRVVCYEESSPFPPSGDVAALQAKYKDGIPTVFAFVGISASITYLQINPTDLPVFIPEELQ